MSFLALIVAAILLGIVLYFTLEKRLNRRNVAIFGVIFLALSAAITSYTLLQDSAAKVDADLIARFNRGESLKCGDLAVNPSDFFLISGTLSFVGKKNTPHAGRTISLKECR